MNSLKARFPSQFWLMFVGMLFSAVGTSMIWPFLMVYVSSKLGMPLATIALIFTVNAATSVAAGLIAGPIVDKVGRKSIMILSMGINGLCYLTLIFAQAYWQFMTIIALQGCFSPLYRIASDVTMADILVPEKRADGYSLMRIANNIGVAIGPAVGGFLATRSYTIAFICAFSGLFIYAVLLFFRGEETKVKTLAAQKEGSADGYGYMLRDQKFLHYMLAIILNKVCTATIWIMLPVYAIQFLGITEGLYGFLPTLNAVMVLLLQLPVTQFSKRQNRFTMMIMAALLYTSGALTIMTAKGFEALALAFVIFTLGELILEPTAATYIAEIAPPHMRGRYMGVAGQAWNAGQGVGPVMSGALSDTFGPRSQWAGAAAASLMSAMLFAALRLRNKNAAQASPAGDEIGSV